MGWSFHAINANNFTYGLNNILMLPITLNMKMCSTYVQWRRYRIKSCVKWIDNTKNYELLEVKCLAQGNNDNTKVARPGIEPTTFWLVRRCPDHLAMLAHVHYTQHVHTNERYYYDITTLIPKISTMIHSVLTNNLSPNQLWVPFSAAIRINMW